MNLEGDKDTNEKLKKELPVWLAESTVVPTHNSNSNDRYAGNTKNNARCIVFTFLIYYHFLTG